MTDYQESDTFDDYSISGELFFFFFFNMSYVEKMQMRTLTSEGSTVVFQITGVDAVWKKHTYEQQTLYKTLRYIREHFFWSF